jgi:nucleoside-diphosphate-sugar epimerase
MPDNPMRILLIGGTGNISAECAALLRSRGHDIAIVTRGRSPVPPACRALIADRRDRDAMRRAIGRLTFDAVINFLGYKLPDVEADYDLFASRITQYIFISSATVYAKPHRRLPVTEESLLGNPFSDYARQKKACEEWLLARHRESGFPVTIVRPSHTYSRRWIPNPVSSAGYTFAARMEQGKPVFVHDNGQGLWTLTASEDFATGLAGLVGQAPAVGEAFTITSDEVLTWNQIYADIARALRVTDPPVCRIPTDFICRIRPDMTAKLKGDKAEPGVFDNAKIKRWVPEYQCRKCFRDGIGEAVAWFRADPSRQESNPAVDALFDQVIAAWQG